MIHSQFWNRGISGWGSKSSSYFVFISVWISWNAQKGHQLRPRLWNQDGIAVSLCKWQHYSGKKLFTIWCRDVTDVHEVLEFTVYDDNRDHKYSFLGKVWPRIVLKNLQWIEELFFQVVLPLLNIPTGDHWHYLKDKNLRKMAKGLEPRILLNVTLVFNP